MPASFIVIIIQHLLMEQVYYGQQLSDGGSDIHGTYPATDLPGEQTIDTSYSH